MTYVSSLAAQAEELLEAYRLELSAYSPHQLNWTPAPGQWSAGQVVQHLLSSHRGYHRQFARKIPRARAENRTADREFHPGPVGRWFNALLMNGTRKYKTLRAFNPGRSGVPEDIVERFASMQREFITLLNEARELDLERISVASPAMPLLRFRLGDAFRILLTHQERHLRQIRRIRTHDSFPP